MNAPASWHGEALNPVPDSENRIHSDEVARELGFEGALVPGVTVSAYLTHPAVVAWGEEWLARGSSHIVVKKPVYDRRAFRVDVLGATACAYDAELFDSTGTLCAVGHFELPARLPPPPGRRGDPPVTERPPPTRAGLERLRERGMGSIQARWGEGAPMTTYLRDVTAMPELLRLDGAGRANASFLLGLTNWLVAANVDLGPWVHLETEAQHHALVPRDTELAVEGRVVDLFEKKGHEFADVDVAVYLPDDSPALTARLRAIYRLRGA